TNTTSTAANADRGLCGSHQRTWHGSIPYPACPGKVRECRRDGALKADPLTGIDIRTPKALPRVPTEDDLRAILGCCPPTFEGTRNRTLILCDGRRWLAGERAFAPPCGTLEPPGA